MNAEQKRRTELNLVGGDLRSVRVQDGVISALLVFPNRGATTTARKSLTGTGWRVVTYGVRVQATVKL